MNKELQILFLTSLLVLVFLLSGCVNQDARSKVPESLSRNIPHLDQIMGEKVQVESRTLKESEVKELEREGDECASSLEENSYERTVLKGNLEIKFWREKSSQEISCVEVISSNVKEARKALNWSEMERKQGFRVFFSQKTYKSCQEACQAKGYSEVKEEGCISFIDCESGLPVLSNGGAPCETNRVCCCRGKEKQKEQQSKKEDENCMSFCKEKGFSDASNKGCVYPMACVTGNHPYGEDEGAPCSGMSVCCCRYN